MKDIMCRCAYPQEILIPFFPFKSISGTDTIHIIFSDDETASFKDKDLLSTLEVADKNWHELSLCGSKVGSDLS